MLGRSFFAASAAVGIFVFAIAFGCIPKGKYVPPGGLDMTVVEDLGPTVAVGHACQNDVDCGAKKTCWKNLLGETDEAAIQGGYCAATCGKDADCDKNSVCVALVNTNAGGTGAGNYCMLNCTQQSSCNRAASVFECWSGIRTDVNICYPNGPMGTIEGCVPGTAGCQLAKGGIGGCVRRTTDGPVGVCEAPCVIGTNTCSADPISGLPRQCLVNDPTILRNGDPNTTNSADKFRGTACFQIPMTTNSKPSGSACVLDNDATLTYYNDVCAQGLQCLIGQTTLPADRLCRALCYNPALATKPTAPSGGTVAPDCPSGKTCQDVWSLFGSTEPKYQVGLCTL